MSVQFFKIMFPRHESVFTYLLKLVKVAWKACNPIFSCFERVYNHMFFVICRNYRLIVIEWLTFLTFVT